MWFTNRILLLILLPIIGAIVGYRFATLEENGQFVQWELLPSLPDKAVQIVFVDTSNVWVETESGVIYKYQGLANCKNACWQVSKVPTPQGFIVVFDAPTCGRLPSGPSDANIEAIYIFSNDGCTLIAYSLDKDGRVYVWQHKYSNDDWEAFNELFAVFTGSLIGYFIALGIGVVGRRLFPQVIL